MLMRTICQSVGMEHTKILIHVPAKSHEIISKIVISGTILGIRKQIELAIK